jgi:CheY-like chemotaxis protein
MAMMSRWDMEPALSNIVCNKASIRPTFQFCDDDMPGAAGVDMFDFSARLTEGPLLTGRRVLIVEDEYFLADDMRSALRALGADIAGPAADIADALRILHDGGVIDGAVLDVNIRQQMIYPVARELQARGVPIVFTSGYDKIVLGTEFADVPLWEKPFDQRAMAHGLAGMILRGDPMKQIDPQV